MKKFARRLAAGLFLICLVSLNFNFLIQPAHAAGEIIITEVMSAPTDGNEWVELYNPTAASVNLENWALYEGSSKHPLLNKNLIKGSLDLGPNAYIVLAGNGADFASSTPDVAMVLDISATSLHNQGEDLILTNNSSTPIYETNYGSTATPGNSKQWKDGSWIESTPTPGAPTPESPPPTPPACGNGILETGETCDDGNLISDDGCDSFCVIETPSSTTSTPPVTPAPTSTAPTIPKSDPCPLGSVVINELVSDPIDDGVEWVELYNRSTKTVDLIPWLIQDAGESPHTIAHETLELAGLDYLVLYKSKDFNFALNNSGDILQLVCYNNVMDSVTYGKFDDGRPEDNAPVAKDPFSLARVDDGRDTNSDMDDFSVTATPTPGRANIINATTDATTSPEDGQVFTGQVFINEILPNPAGSDSQTEFIELYNNGEQAVDLTGWKLGDSGARQFTLTADKFTDLNLAAGKYMVFWRKDTGIALNNSGQDSAKLYWPNGKIASQIDYSGSIKDDLAYARAADGAWFWSQKATPAATNEIIQANQCPQAVINLDRLVVINQPTIFDASDSSDPDGEALNYLWTFADKTTSSQDVVTKTFTKTASQKATLEVTDENDCATKTTVEFEILSSAAAVKSPTPSPSTTSAPPNNSISTLGIFLSEILPNPKGADAGQEWLEICSDAPAQLVGASLELTGSGQPKDYSLSDLNWTQAGCQQIFTTDLKITLPNAQATLRLKDAAQNILSEVAYQNAPDGQSYSYDSSSGWTWMPTPTPGAFNAPTISSAAAVSGSALSLAAIKDLPLDSLLVVRGQVSVLPGVLGSQIFYLSAENIGLQIYMYKKDFPALKLGDWLEVTGTLTASGQQKRLKVTDRNDIIVIKNENLPTPPTIALAELQNDYLDGLIGISAILNSRSNRTWIVSSDDQSLEIYFKTGINIPPTEPGTPVEIAGILNWSTDHYRLYPRAAEDIVIPATTTAALEPVTSSTRDFLAGEAMSLTLGGNEDWQRAWRVLGLAGAGLGLFLLGLRIGRQRALN